MRWWLVVVVVVGACGGSGARGDAGVPPGDTLVFDAALADAAPVDAAPLDACAIGSAVPALPEICIAGWCWEAPRPLGYVSATFAAGSELWFALPTHTVRIVGTQVTSAELPIGLDDPVTRLYGSSTVRWALTASGHLLRLGTSWTMEPGLVRQLAPVGDDEAWAIGSGQLSHSVGGQWSVEPLPAELVATAQLHVELDAVHASSSSELWISGTVVDVMADTQTHWVSARTATGWTSRQLPFRVAAIWSFGPADAWFAGARVAHWDGMQLHDYPVTASALVAISATELWGVDPSSHAASHWDGQSWSSCAAPGLRTVTIRGPGDLWGTRDDGTLAHFDGTGWSATSQLEPIDALAVCSSASGDRVVSLGDAAGVGVFRRRSSTATWPVDPSFPGSARVGLRCQTSDDLWAFGPGAVHFDGTAWQDTQPPAAINDLCMGSGTEAFASTASGLAHYDGTSWTTESTASFARVFCMPGWGVWAATPVFGAPVAHRVGTEWRIPAPSDQLVRPYVSPTGVVWSLGDGISRWDRTSWAQDELRGLSMLIPPGSSAVSFLDITGTSASPEVDVLAMEYTSPTTVAYYLLHHDGTRFTTAKDVTGTSPIQIGVLRDLASDDALLVRFDFETERVHGGSITTLAPALAAGDSIGISSTSVWFGSLGAGWAISNEGHLMRFDGSSWARAASAPAGWLTQLQAFSSTDLWTLVDGRSIAHFDGLTWTVQLLPAIHAGDPAVALWGASSSDLWVASSTQLWRVRGGPPALFDPGGPASEQPVMMYGISGTATDDVWFAGRHLDMFQYNLALYHWDGTSFRRYRTIHAMEDMQIVGGELLAAAYDAGSGKEVWQYRDPGGWMPRPDLDPQIVFPSIPFAARAPFVNELLVTQATGPRWAGGARTLTIADGGVLWRHD